MSAHQEPSHGEPVDFASFDELVETLARWSGSLPEWPPARSEPDHGGTVPGCPVWRRVADPPTGGLHMQLRLRGVFSQASKTAGLVEDKVR